MSLSITNEKQIFILDGSFSSQLAKHVHRNIESDNGPLWTAQYLYTNPDAVQQTHLDYLRAGTDFISTNTYQASLAGFKKYLNLSDEDGYKLFECAVKLAKQGRDIYLSENKVNFMPKIAGSVGPYGAYLHDLSEYNGSYAETTSIETMRDWHRPRLETLIKSGVDCLAIETIPCSKEAEMLASLLKEYPSIKAWMSFTCKDGKSLANGENFQEIAKRCWKLNPEQIIAVGVNCSSPNFVAELFKDFNKGYSDTPVPLITYPNSGEKYIPNKGWVEDEKCNSIETYVDEWLELGVKYVGGCCRTDVSHIIKIKDNVKKWCERKGL